VFAEEPTTQSPLFELDQVVVTPHLGASTAEAQDKAGVTIAEQLLLALAGQFVPSAVNVDAGPVPDALRPFVGLVEKLGQLYTAMAGGGPGGRTSAVGGGRLQIDYVGALVEADIRGPARAGPQGGGAASGSPGGVPPAGPPRCCRRAAPRSPRGQSPATAATGST